MDHFGIGSAVSGAYKAACMAGRGSGRTTSLVESLKNGDRVVFLSEREGRRVQSLCAARDVTIEIIVSDPRSLDRLVARPPSLDDGRTIFDHGWVEQFYEFAIERASSDIDRLQTMLSGHGAPHRATRRQAEQFAKWGF